MIVEDETMVAMMLKAMVQDFGYEVIALVSNEKEALDAIENNTFDIAILDVNLGGNRSYGIADELIRRDIPFVFSTGYPKNTIDARYRDWPVIGKPFRADDLEKTLATTFSAAGPQ
jgi:two-component SAPR family response regulator